MGEYAITVKDMTKRYRKKGQPAIDDLTLSLHSNQIIGLIGTNGSGKTTFMKICAGELSAAGELSVLGGDVTRNMGIRTEVLYSTYALPLENYKVSRIVNIYDTAYPNFDREFADKLLKLFQIPDREAKGLSQGTKSMLFLICALAARAKVTMLDEPFIGIDIKKRKRAYEILLRDYMEYPRTFLISSHNLKELEHLLSEMVLIEDGKLIFYKDMDEVRQMLFRADGANEAVGMYLDRQDVIYHSFGELGSFLIARGNMDCPMAKELKREGLKISNVSPEDAVVYLTANREEDLECLWEN